MDKKPRELIVIRASVTANCVPFFNLHFVKSREMGGSDDGIPEALSVERMRDYG
jgi:AhpD family alkylhydroperoxidase